MDTAALEQRCNQRSSGSTNCGLSEVEMEQSHNCYPQSCDTSFVKKELWDALEGIVLSPYDHTVISSAHALLKIRGDILDDTCLITNTKCPPRWKASNTFLLSRSSSNSPVMKPEAHPSVRGRSASLGSNPNKPKVYACNYCGAVFQQNGNLERHILTHTGTRLFECGQCHKRFSQKNHLTQHMLSHTGEAPFECNICGQRFSRKGNMLTHQRVHTGEKPFECEVCHGRFSQKQHLIHHARTHSSGKMPSTRIRRRHERKNHITSYAFPGSSRRSAQSIHLTNRPNSGGESADNAIETSSSHRLKGPLYCLCRQPNDPKKFYLQCSICNEWFHGKCVGIAEEEAASIDFICKSCS